MIHRIHGARTCPASWPARPTRSSATSQSVHDFSTVAFPQPINQLRGVPRRRPGRLLEDPRLDDGVSLVPRRRLVRRRPCRPAWSPTRAGRRPTTPVRVCHPASGSLAGILDKHYAGELAPTAPHLHIAIDGVSSTPAGTAPTVDFTVTVDGAGRDILTSPLDRLRVTFAGPTTDIAQYWQVSIQNGGVDPDQRHPDRARRHQRQVRVRPERERRGAGRRHRQLPGRHGGAHRRRRRHPVRQQQPGAGVRRHRHDRGPAPHRGRRRQLQQVPQRPQPPRRLAPRPAVLRVLPQPQQRQLGHDPLRDRRGPGREPRPQVVHPQDPHGRPTLDPFQRISGTSQANPGGNVANDFSEVRFPRDAATCTACHTDTTYALPLATDLGPSLTAEWSCLEDPTADTNDYCDNRRRPNWVSTDLPLAPEVAVCTSCHDAGYVAVHAALNTTTDGKTACATCHGPGAIEDVQVVHGLK